MKAVILESYVMEEGDLDWSGVKALVPDTTSYVRTDYADIAPRIGDAELVLINKCRIDEAVLAQCPNLKWVGIIATGTDNIDLEACRRHGVAVANVPGYSTYSVAQMTFSLLLAICQCAQRYDRAVKDGYWQHIGLQVCGAERPPGAQGVGAHTVPHRLGEGRAVVVSGPVIRTAQAPVQHRQLVGIQRGLHGVKVVIIIGNVIHIIAFQLIPDAGMLIAVAAGADGQGLARGNEQPAHSDIAVRDIGHRHKSMAAGVDGGIALVIRHGVDTQHGHGTLCRGSTVDVGRGLAAGLLKDIRPAKVGGKAFYVPQKGIPAGQVGDRFVLFRGGLGGLCLLCKGRQAEAEGQGQHGKQSAERFFHGNVLHYSMKCCKILGNAAV